MELKGKIYYFFDVDNKHNPKNPVLFNSRVKKDLVARLNREGFVVDSSGVEISYAGRPAGYINPNEIVVLETCPQLGELISTYDPSHFLEKRV